MVPMRDGTRLATEVLLPSEGGPCFPVVLVRTVYGRKYDGIARTAKQNGIAVVSQDTRGYGESEGEKMQFSADGAEKLRDGVDTVTWIKGQPWCNGKVGTWGASALGITQVLLAPVRNDLACQMIIVAPSSMFPVFQRGGVPQKMLSERYAKRMGHEKWFAERHGKHPTYDEAWRLQDTDSLRRRHYGSGRSCWRMVRLLSSRHTQRFCCARVFGRSWRKRQSKTRDGPLGARSHAHGRRSQVSQ